MDLGFDPGERALKTPLLIAVLPVSSAVCCPWMTVDHSESECLQMARREPEVDHGQSASGLLFILHFSYHLNGIIVCPPAYQS